MTAAVESTPLVLPRLDDAGRAALFTEARTANSFLDTPVTDAELSSVWDLAKWAPTAANLQPLRVLFVRGDGRSRVVAHMAEGNQAKTSTAPAIAVLAFDTRFHEHVPTVLPIRPELEAVFEAQATMRLEHARFNSALQAGYFMLAVRAHGLAAGPMAGFDATAMDAEFFPDGRWKSFLVVNIGHPGENPWYDRLPRLEHTDVVRWA